MSSDLHNTELQSRADAAIAEMVRKYNIAVEGLTEQQTASAIRQAIACGDFQRLISEPRFSQAVVYIPFREHERLKSRIAYLERQLREHGFEPKG